mmetsp:Transcript_6973/g.13159  ORF Transcript_6973/g.13159 Transcript_6973/m.13159 type:complete len:587 (+) Transcript_6973:35-1795(+)
MAGSLRLESLLFFRLVSCLMPHAPCWFPFLLINLLEMKLVYFLFAFVLCVHIPQCQAFAPPHLVRLTSTSRSTISISSSPVTSRIPSTIQHVRITTSLDARRPLLSEDDLATPPDPKVIEAVESLNSNNVLASDVAAKAGISLSQTRQSLSALASLTRGDISVTSSGELLYSFPTSIKSALSTNSLRYRLTSLWLEKIWPNLFWAIRVGFGVFLFISIAVIFSTLLFIQTGGGGESSDRDDNRDERRGGGASGGLGFRYGMGDFLFDLFYPRTFYSPYYGYYGRIDPYDTRQMRQAESQERSGIFEGIFSYIFGDGDPNRTMEAARLREASRVIRENDGAVTAEQLAPFCDVDDPDEMGNEFLVEEGFVLPIVSQLGGEPVVTDEGDIIYVFPDLQISATSTKEQEERDAMYGFYEEDMDREEYLEEKNIEFSRNPAFGNVAAAALGVVNLGGAAYLGQVLASPSLSGVTFGGVFGLVQAGYPLLLAYAILFNAIPLFRYFYINKVNTEINKRNSARRKWKTYLEVGGTNIRRKMEAAKALKRKMKRIGGKNGEGIVYDTRDAIEDVTKQKQIEEMKRFDELLDDN